MICISLCCNHPLPPWGNIVTLGEPFSGDNYIDDDDDTGDDDYGQDYGDDNDDNNFD